MHRRTTSTAEPHNPAGTGTPTGPNNPPSPARGTVRRDPWPWQAVGLVLMVLIPVGLGSAAGLLTTEETDGWYAQAEKAPWTPPNWVFGPVWTALYSAMGVAAWLIWRERHRVPAWSALSVYIGQLILNLTWSPLFFGGYPLWGTAALWAAMAVIMVLLILILVTIRLFWPISRPAAVLLIPYALWVAYASTLNLYIAVMN